MMKKHFRFIPLAALILIQVACCTTANGQACLAPTQATPSSTAPAVYQPGQIVVMGDRNITLVGYNFAEGVLLARFRVENTSEEQIFFNTQVDFTAQIGNQKLAPLGQDCGDPLPSGMSPGGSLQGDLCWNLQQAGVVTIMYNGTVTWKMMVQDVDVSQTPTPGQ